MPENETPGGNFKERLFESIFRDGTPDHRAKLAELLLAADTVSPEIALERLRASTVRRYPVLHLVPWAALFTVVGGLATAGITGTLEIMKDLSKQNHDERMADISRQSSVFSQLMVVDPATLLVDGDERASQDDLKNERKARICMAAIFGIVKIPDYVLGIQAQNTGSYADELSKFLNEKYECDKNFVSSSFPVIVSRPNPLRRPVCDAKANVAPPPLDYPQTPELPAIAKQMLKFAIDEFNKGVDEVCEPEEVAKYFGVTNIEGVPQETPWSAAFVSWVVKSAGNPANLQLSALNQGIWESALRQGLVIEPTQTLPGDIIIFLSSGSFNNGINADDIRKGPSDRRWTSTSGIVLKVDGDKVSFISGNISNQVGISERSLSDLLLVGVIRVREKQTHDR
ncbi:C40 family peptidase [Rhizobium alvei]|uniref:DUF2272 domain-containing protein n=1 Tax=Rhizobium alvei TaxID=1132659 RepID=A0ABT8YK11_9HYPH|nr:DUF2272 domain-containing protein [Rhizobium alvei]MDO6964002.1 DUF2272 domain-containing protein [Rhizobium alvei]